MNEEKKRKPLSRIELDFLMVHLLFTVICVLVLIAPVGVKLGIKMLGLVIIYNIIIPVFGIWRRYKDWMNLWLFVFILSLFQIWPDWFLSAQLNILVFPEDGLIKIGTVSAYMAGLWTIPLFLIVFTGQRFQENYSRSVAYLAVALTSLVIFGASEQTSWMLPSWYAQNVFMIGHIAVYIMIPEIILGLSTYSLYEIIKDRKHWVKIPAAFIAMQLYLGSAAFFYFFIEKVLITQ
jgi:hypothetical protein